MWQEVLVEQTRGREEDGENYAINHQDLQDHRDHRSTSSPRSLEKFLVTNFSLAR